MVSGSTPPSVPAVLAHRDSIVHHVPEMRVALRVMLAAIASLARHTLTDQAQAAPHRRLQFARLFNQEDSVTGGACQDNNENCDGWAADGECAANPGYMHVECPLSCKRCTALAKGGAAVQRRRPPVRAGCHDEDGYDCEAKAKAGGCEFDKGEMLPRCPRTCNVCHFLSTIVEAFGCEDKHPTCKSWASAGECTANKGFMSEQCTESCGTCEQKRQACNRPPDTPPLVTPGEISVTSNPNPNPNPNLDPNPNPSPNPNPNPSPRPSPNPNQARSA